MHFHHMASCMNCHIKPVFDTPIPNVLILSTRCTSCGWNDWVGWDGERPCTPCLEQWREDVRREARSGEHSPFSNPYG